MDTAAQAINDDFDNQLRLCFSESGDNDISDLSDEERLIAFECLTK